MSSCHLSLFRFTQLWPPLRLALPLFVLAGLSSTVAADGDPAAAIRETRAALDMARAELQRDLSNEALSDSEVADFRAYLLSLEQQLEQQCHLIPEHRRPTGVCELAPKNTVSVDTIREQTEEERSKSLDQELEASLSAFDQMLLEEQERLSAQASGPPSGGGGNAEGGEGGSKAGEGEDSNSGRDSGQQDDDANDRNNAEQNRKQQNSRKGRESSQASARNDPDRPARWEDVAPSPGTSGERTADQSREPLDGQDDDVVARQIREAAEKETDPRLREKLWEEYRRYKSGQ